MIAIRNQCKSNDRYKTSGTVQSHIPGYSVTKTMSYVVIVIVSCVSPRAAVTAPKPVESISSPRHSRLRRDSDPTPKAWAKSGGAQEGRHRRSRPDAPPSSQRPGMKVQLPPPQTGSPPLRPCLSQSPTSGTIVTPAVSHSPSPA